MTRTAKWVLLGVAGFALCAGLGLWAFHRGKMHPVADAPGSSEPTDYPLEAPPLRLRMIRWQIGTTPPGKEVNRRIEITNTTSRSWTLRATSSNCSCASARLAGTGSVSDRVIPPGKSSWVKLTYKAPREDGKVSANLLIEFAEPDSPILQVILEAEVRRRKDE